MSELLAELTAKAAARIVPLSVHFDLTWRCNEHCMHCYVCDRTVPEMPLAGVEDVLRQLAGAGTLFLCLSGGEILLREDIIPIVEAARALLFNVTLKTNGTLLGEREARRFAELAVSQVHVTLHSSRPDIHDGITGVPGSFDRTLAALRLLAGFGVRTRITHVAMPHTAADLPALRGLAAAVGADLKVDPTVTPDMDGRDAGAALRVQIPDLRELFRDPSIVDDPDKFCAPPAAAGPDVLDDFSCGAGHNACYISPAGDVMPCIQFPNICGNVRKQPFIEIWRSSEAFARIRAIRTRDLPVCRACANVSICSRCPGLAYMAGDLRGPSLLDCEKAYARTGVPTPLVPSPEPASGKAGVTGG